MLSTLLFVVINVVSSLRIMQDTSAYTKLSAFIQTITSIPNVSALSNRTLINNINLTDVYINDALSAAQQYLTVEGVQTNKSQYNDTVLSVNTVKAAKLGFINYLQAPPTPMLGVVQVPVDPYPNDTIFSITEVIFRQNPYKAQLTFPYPYSTFEVALLYITNQYNITKLPNPLPYIFDTLLVYTGLVNDTVRLGKFLYQTHLIACITRNESQFWVQDGLQKLTLVHPSGRILIQCNSNASNLPVTIINDTGFVYHKNPSPPLPPAVALFLQFDQTIVFRVTVALTGLFAIFIYCGCKYDAIQFKRDRDRRLMRMMQNDLSGTATIDEENHRFQKLQSKDKVLQVKVYGNDVNFIKKQKKTMIQGSQIQDGDNTPIQKKSSIKEEQENIMITPTPGGRGQLYRDEPQLDSGNESDHSDDSYDRYQRQKKHKDTQYSQNRPKIKRLHHDKEDRIVVKQEPILPPINCLIFVQIFLKVHELYSSFFTYSKEQSRASRFFTSYCKIMLILALSGYFSAKFPLNFNIIFGLIGLIVANIVSHIAAIVLKHKGLLYDILGMIVLLAILALSGYIMMLSYTGLKQEYHDVWLYTFLVVSMADMWLIEFIVTGMKTCTQPNLSGFRDKEDPISAMIYVTFWDVKLQSIWKKTYSQMNTQENQFTEQSPGTSQVQQKIL